MKARRNIVTVVGAEQTMSAQALIMSIPLKISEGTLPELLTFLMVRPSTCRMLDKLHLREVMHSDPSTT